MQVQNLCNQIFNTIALLLNFRFYFANVEQPNVIWLWIKGSPAGARFSSPAFVPQNCWAHWCNFTHVSEESAGLANDKSGCDAGQNVQKRRKVPATRNYQRWHIYCFSQFPLQWRPSNLINHNNLVSQIIFFETQLFLSDARSSCTVSDSSPPDLMCFLPAERYYLQCKPDIEEGQE